MVVQLKICRDYIALFQIDQEAVSPAARQTAGGCSDGRAPKGEGIHQHASANDSILGRGLYDLADEMID